VKLAQAPLEKLVAGSREIFGDALVGVYLHGSAALGCYGPHSDVDVVIAIERSSTPDEQHLLASLCLDVSRPTWEEETHCLLELDVVVAPALRPWRHPAPLDFHYSESSREAFERGVAKPWSVDESTDLAAHLTVLNAAGVVIAGEPIASVFPAVPVGDYHAAIRADRQWCLDRIGTHKLYVVLGLPRVWAGLETDDVHSKASAAEWALPRLPDELRPVLRHGLAVYRGEADAAWDDLPVDDYVAWVAARIPS
jgi:predicted nucleotidyltransferase